MEEKFQKKLVFVAHPMRGDMAGNMEKVSAICARIYGEGHVPIAPYLVSFPHLRNGAANERELGVEANLVSFERGFIDELWLYGDRISEGMKIEVALARKLGIPVVAKSEGTQRDLRDISKTG